MSIVKTGYVLTCKGEIKRDTGFAVKGPPDTQRAYTVPCVIENKCSKTEQAMV